MENFKGGGKRKVLKRFQRIPKIGKGGKIILLIYFQMAINY